MADKQEKSLGAVGHDQVSQLGEAKRASVTDELHNYECEPLFDGVIVPDGKARREKKAGRVTRKQLMDLLQEQNYRCALTGVELTPETASVDHKIPLQQGGNHSIANLHIVEHRINWAKGTMTVEEFLEMCRRVVEYQNR